MEVQEYHRLTGTVEHIVYQKEENGFTVLELASAGELVTVVGEMPGVAEGEELVLTGNYVAHPTFGSQFRVSVYERQLPASAGAIYNICAGAIKGSGLLWRAPHCRPVRRKYAGCDGKDPGQLCQVKGVSQRKAEEIAQEFKRIFGVRTVMLFLAKYQIHSSICVRVWKKWAAGAIDVIRENPYVLCRRTSAWILTRPTGSPARWKSRRMIRAALRRAPVCTQPQPGQWSYLSAG